LTSIRVALRAQPWLTSPRQNQNVVISMKAVRRAAHAVKRIHDEQTRMWEGFWRASRFPVN
jgi:DNA-binding transcriptional regulator PaaX